MTSLRLPRLSRPGVLESIAPDRLSALLHPFESFFESRAICIKEPTEMNCQAIIRAIMLADRDTPVELLDAICIIDEMATSSAIDQLRDRVSNSDLRLEPDGEHTAADIAAAAWLHQRDKLLHVHAQGRLKRARSFDYFQSNHSKPPLFVMPESQVVRSLELDLDSWFQDRLRGRGSRVEIFANDSEVELSIRHGNLFRREQTLDDGVFGLIAYRPVQCDAAIYNRTLGELRINAKSQNEKALYCRLIGKHLFADENCFPSGEKYSLEPLRDFGLASLSPGDIDGIRSVRLVELRLNDYEGIENAITVRKADNLFSWAQRRNKGIQTGRRLLEATFKMRLIGRRDERTITIRPPNVAIYNRGNDSHLIETWLVQRGFIVGKVNSKRIRHEPALASA